MQRINQTGLQGILMGIIFILDFFIINISFLKVILTKMQTNINELIYYGFYLFKYSFLILGIIIIVLSLSYLHYKKPFCSKDNLKKGLIKLIILIVTIIIFFIFLELFLIHGAFSFKFQQSDLILHHSNIPNLSSNFKSPEWNVFVNINSEGLRDGEIKSEDSYNKRILVLGDSFTWGWGVNDNETFSQLLEQELRNHNYKIDVINAGSLSYSPILEYLYLKEKGLSYKPDIIILNFDFSDVQDDYIYGEQAIFDKNGEILAVPSNSPKKKTSFFGARSLEFTYNLLKKVYSKFSTKKQLDSSLIYDINYSRYFMMFNGSYELNKAHWDRTLSYISLINDLCKKKNIEFVLVVYPYGVQVNENEWTSGRYTFGFGSEKIYDDSSVKILEEYCKKNSISFLNTFEDFKSSDKYPLFFSYDGHFTKNGHRLLSETLFNYLDEENSQLIK